MITINNLFMQRSTVVASSALHRAQGQLAGVGKSTAPEDGPTVRLTGHFCPVVIDDSGQPPLAGKMFQGAPKRLNQLYSRPINEWAGFIGVTEAPFRHPARLGSRALSENTLLEGSDAR